MEGRTAQAALASSIGSSSACRREGHAPLFAPAVVRLGDHGGRMRLVEVDPLLEVLGKVVGGVQPLLRLCVLAAPRAELQQAQGVANNEGGHACVLPRSARMLSAVEGNARYDGWLFIVGPTTAN